MSWDKGKACENYQMLILAAVPVGNPGDATTNLREVITRVGHIAAEDSRKFGRLCADLGITHTAKVISFFEGNESERISELITILKTGNDLLVVTDAGMPGVSDPGYRLVRAALENNIEVKVLPGPSAVTTALLLSGLPTDRFCFEGFPPRTAGARLAWYQELAHEPRTMVFFEAPHRLSDSLSDAATAFGADRSAAVCREMTKTYEEIVRGPLSDLVKWSISKEMLGEVTVVVHGYSIDLSTITDEEIVAKVLWAEAAGISRKEAIAEVVTETKLAKRQVFDAMVAHKSGAAKNDKM
jgi:16S rRNA (cytidine1402-2'-O)-methyltransferase